MSVKIDIKPTQTAEEVIFSLTTTARIEVQLKPTWLEKFKMKCANITLRQKYPFAGSYSSQN